MNVEALERLFEDNQFIGFSTCSRVARWRAFDRRDGRLSAHHRLDHRLLWCR